MNTAAPLQLVQVHGRRDIIADDGYWAVAPKASRPLDAQVRQRVRDLTEQIITLVLTALSSLDAMRSIGLALAHFHYLWTDFLAATRTSVQQLIAEPSAEQVILLYPRLPTLELTLRFLLGGTFTLLGLFIHLLSDDTVI